MSKEPRTVFKFYQDSLPFFIMGQGCRFSAHSIYFYDI